MDLLSTSDVPGSIRGIGDTSVNPTDNGPCPQREHILSGETDCEEIRPNQGRGG